MALLVLLLVLAPLAVVYALRKAGRARAEIVAGQRSTASKCLRMLVFPAIVAGTAGMALVHFGWLDGSDDFAASIGIAARTDTSSLYTGNGVADFFLWIALAFGNLMVFLFFVTIPYVMGSLLAVGLVLSGWGGALTGKGGQETLGDKNQ